MNFKEALKELEHGKWIKLPDWGGFWFKGKDGEIYILTRENEIIKMRDGDLFKTLSYVSEDNWEIVEITGLKYTPQFQPEDDFFPKRPEITC